MAHLSFLFMYGDVRLKPTYSNASVIFFVFVGRVLLRTFGVIVGLSMQTQHLTPLILVHG